MRHKKIGLIIKHYKIGFKIDINCKVLIEFDLKSS